jgi:hypothetical protein
MTSAFLIQAGASAVAVAAMTALAAWARIARPQAPLDEARVRALLAEEFPGRVMGPVWIAADGTGALARSGAWALVLLRVGDGYAARHVPWTKLAGSGPAVTIDFAEAAAPRTVLTLAGFPAAEARA